MKSAKELLKKLPLQVRLTVTELIRKEAPWNKNKKFDDLETVLTTSFIFNKTKQGHKYWMNIIEKFNE